MAVRKTKKGLALKRWFKEKWVDVRTGKPCGRTKGEKNETNYMSIFIFCIILLFGVVLIMLRNQ